MRERRRSLLQGSCCYSKHLPLCGRPSRPIVVQKLVVLPLAPFGSRGMRQTPLLFWVQDTRLERCLAPATITTSCGPLPSLPKHSYPSVIPPHSPAQAYIPIVFSAFLLYSYSSFLLWCICLLFFGAPSLYPWLYFKGLSL